MPEEITHSSKIMVRAEMMVRAGEAFASVSQTEPLPDGWYKMSVSEADGNRNFGNGAVFTTDGNETHWVATKVDQYAKGYFSCEITAWNSLHCCCAEPLDVRTYEHAFVRVQDGQIFLRVGRG